MVLKGTTRLLESRLRIKGKRGKITEYTRFLFHVPSKICKDSQFPFKPGQELTITVDPKGKIVLEPYRHRLILRRSRTSLIASAAETEN